MCAGLTCGADLRGSDLRKLPLARLRGGPSITQRGDTSLRLRMREAAAAHLEEADVSAAHLEQASLRGCLAMTSRRPNPL
jgi:hypothetical protein